MPGGAQDLQARTCNRAMQGPAGLGCASQIARTVNDGGRHARQPLRITQQLVVGKEIVMGRIVHFDATLGYCTCKLAGAGIATTLEGKHHDRS